MNVRERAKTFEAFMSSNTDSLLPESEPKRSNGDTGEDISGSAASNGQKQPGQEKQKPVPPPRKTRKRAQSRPDSPQSLQNTPTKTSNEKQQPEKPKIPPKKPPPPRPAPYKKLSSSSSVVSHIPHAKTKELSASLSRRREASEAKQTPRPSSGGSPKTTRKAHSRESPAKPPRGSSRSSPSSSPKVSRSPSKVSSCEIHLSHDFVKEDSQEKVPKKNPQRPPPPQRTSSLKRKTKPPVPPKPKRSPKPREVLDKKAATIPRTGSVESKEVATNNSTEEALAKDVETKQRSLSTPLLTTEPRDSEVEENVHENGLEESHKVEETLELKNDNMDTAHINGIDESLKTSDIDNTEIISKESEDKSIDNSEEALSTSENVDNAIISFKDETSTTVDDSDKTFEETSLYDTEHENNGECSIDEKSAHDNEQEPSPDHSEQETSESKEVGNEIVIDEQKEQRDVDNEEQNVKDENEKHSDAKCIDHDDIENSNLSQSSALCKEEGVSEVSSEMEEDKANDNGTKDSRLNENEDVKGIFSVCEPMETNIDDIINGNNLEFATGHFEENASEKVVVLSEDETPNENENVMEKATVDNTSKEQQIETINEDVSDEISSKIESSLDKEEHEDAERAIFAECDINDVQSEAIAVDETTFDDDTKDQQVEENRIDVQERPLVETDPNTHTKEGEFEEETESNVEKYLPNEQPIPEEKELVEFQNYPLVETDPNIQMPKGEFEEEPKANVEENVLNEQSLPEEKELEVENYPSVETDPNMQMNESRDVIDIESSVAEINPISPSDAKESIESEISPIPQGPPIEANRSSYLETSLDEEFFSEEELNQEVNDVVHDDEPYETEINIEVSLSTNRSVDMQEDRSILTIDDNGTTDEVETGSGRAEIQKEEPSKVEVSPERVSQYENGVISTEKDKETKEVKKEPVKLARPSRLKKKKNHTYENTSLPPTDVSGTNDEDDTSGKASPEPTGAYENTSIKVQENIESTSTGNDEDDTSGKASPELTGAYENTSIKENIESTSAGNDKPSSPKRTEVYENAVIINQTHQKQEEENREELSTLPATISVKPEKESSPRENRQPAYENVVFPSDDKFAEDDSVYQVPRRKSFHSDSPTTSLVRSTRSASVGSMERKKGGKNVMRTFKTEAESTYVVPTTRASTGTEETYAAPRDVRPSTEETYVTPKSVLTASDTNDIYAAPRPIRTSSADPEEMYATPREISAADDEETYAAPKPIRSVSETTSNSESEYHVPSSLLKEEFPSVEYKVPTSPSKNSIVAADTAAVIVTDDPFLDEELPLRRTTRSSVLTARDHARSAPPKPPRSSADMSEQPVEKPKAIPRTSLGEVQQTPEMSPKASPRPKPRKSQDHSTVEKEENELGTSEVHNDQVASSPKPKRPPPPRPKAPSFSVSGDKNTTENDSESKHKAPPRPPPPPLSRVSIISSEQDPPMDSSSESEEEEQPPAPIGPPKKKTYHIAHEILSTERTFVTALTLCCEDCYDLIKEADVVPESTLNDIFKDLGNIYHLDVKFLNELEERMKTWEEKERIGDIVRKYSYFLKMYTTYINHYDKAQNVLQETVKENIQFAELVHQFQASDKCRGLFLESFMLKPVQRIPSYRLLLKDYLKHLPPDSDEFTDVKVALDTVSEVATHINESMKKSDNFERVLRIQESIGGNAEIVKPGREFIKEGTLQKLCRKDMQERTFFLLTDVLLYTSAVGGGQYKLKGTFPLLGLKVALPDSPEFENEFSVISKSRSFTLSASTQAERDEWIQQITDAISALAKKRGTFMISKDGAVAAPPEGEEDEGKLGEKAPVWIQDTRVTMCMLCTDRFTVTNRRHHCRGCGKVVCGSCSDNLAPLAYLDYEQARVCEVCYEVLLKEQNKSIPVTETDHPPPSPVGIGGDDLDRINRKPPKFEILHRFKPGSKKHNRRSRLFTSKSSVRTEVVGHDSESQMSGYLRFKRTNRHGWKRLWFVLKDNVLYTYKASEDVVAMETIPILGYVVQEATRTEGDEIQFQLKHAGLPPISFKTETESSAFRWTQELRKATTL